MKVAVVGGGIVGLTTALEVQREFRNVSLAVIASSYDDTVSHTAAGLFRIGESFSGPTDEITRKWVKDSYEYYDELCKTPEAGRAGVTNISGYIFSNFDPRAVRNRWMEGVVPIYRPATEEEFNLVGGDWKYGSFFTTVLTQCSLHLPWARQKLRDGGARFEERTISSLKDLGTEYDAIVNCTGLGARELCDDRHVVPLRGQVLKVRAPWIKVCFYGDFDTYVIPGFDGVCTVGGSRHFDSASTKVCPHEIRAIRERCEQLLPSLSKAEVVARKVGLRPHREGGVRVAPELGVGRPGTAVIHNYGHGGYGVCTAPGTAKYAVSLMKEVRRQRSSKL